MSFRSCSSEFKIIDIGVVDPDPSHPRQTLDEAGLKGLSNAIGKMGLIHPLIVRPGTVPGRYTVIAGERRRQAAMLAGETTLPVLVRACAPDEALEVQVFENLGLGVRAPLEPRELATAIQAIAQRFEKQEEAAQYFGRPTNWLNQATAAANLSEKVSALLDAGKISSTSAAVQIEKLARKDEAKAESLIDRIDQLPEGEKISKKAVDSVVAEVSSRRKKKDEPPPPPEVATEATALVASEIATPPWTEVAREAPASLPPPRLSPGKVKLVAEILGLSDDDHEEVLARLIDEFLAMKRA